jgi:hypothetical protein
VLPFCVPKPTLTDEEVPEHLLGRTRTERVDRENRALKAWARDLAETYAGPPDIEGAANLPSVGTVRDKNVPNVFRALDVLPIIAVEDGYDAAVRFAQGFLLLFVESVWLPAARNPAQEIDFHDFVRTFLEEPAVGHLVEPGRVGCYLRRMFERRLLRVGVRRTLQLMAERGKEAPTVPVSAPRRAPAETGG